MTDGHHYEAGKQRSGSRQRSHPILTVPLHYYAIHLLLATHGSWACLQNKAYLERGRRAGSSRGVRPNKGKRQAARLLGRGRGTGSAVRSKAPQIKGAAARSASVIIIMQALRSAWLRRVGHASCAGAGKTPHTLSPTPNTSPYHEAPVS